MPMTMIEKILAAASGRAAVRPGDVVTVQPDLVLTHDHQGPMTIREFKSMGRAGLWDPERLVMVMDHRTPSQTETAAANHKVMREFAESQGVSLVFDVGTGVCHDLLAEKRLVRPGQVVIGTDSHTLTIGALGAFGTGVGSSEMAAIWASGRLWLKTPPTVKITLSGELPPLVGAKDLSLRLLSIFGTDGCTYKAVEFHGPGLAALNMDQRLTLCNMCLEMGAKTALVPFDAVSAAFYAQAGVHGIVPFTPDDGADYEREVSVDLASLDILTAAPNSPGNVLPLREAAQAGVRIDQALIGTCTNGRLTDLREAAAVLKGRKVAPGVRFLIVPATREIMRAALDEGLVGVFLEAGAMVGTPCCGPCGGYGMGALTAGETCITSGSRNFVARLGSPGASIYLGGAAAVAASAVAGALADPRDI